MLGFKMSEEGIEFISSLKGKLGVIAVAGKYRTGKSFLLNRIILNLRESGFGVGPTINPCTKVYIYIYIYRVSGCGMKLSKLNKGTRI